MRTEAGRGGYWHILVLIAAVLGAGLIPISIHVKPAAAATLRPGFQDELVGAFSNPMSLAAMPDGRMLVATKPGAVRVYKNGQFLQTPALSLSGKMCTSKERGLNSVAVDPDFGIAGNNYIYVYYTYKKYDVCPSEDPSNPKNPVNRVSRFVMSGDTIDASTEKVLIDNMPSPDGGHNAGDLKFGKDKYLYVTVGDGLCDYAGDSGCAGQNDAARDGNVLLGKILRITRDGAIPPDNPFQETNSARCNANGRTDPGKICQEIFGTGLRNPFRFAFDPDAAGTRFFINDVGQDAWDEIDEGRPGADYGWNLCEGNHDNPYRAGSVDCASAPYTPPIHEYSHSATGCSSVTGGAFVPDGVWPTSYDNSYMFADYVCNKIFELTPKAGGGFTQTEFASGLAQGGPIAMEFATHGSGKALYYATFANGGEVHRISYTGGGNRVPNAILSADPTSGAVPLEVAFDGSGSRDPDGDPLTYFWEFGDGSTPIETTVSRERHTYTTAGTFTAKLTVKDGRGGQDSATVRIDPGNTPPEPSISSPAPDKLFAVGEKIVLQGSAIDAQDGQLSDGSLSWEVVRHHNNDHTHPYLPPTTGNGVEMIGPAPEDLAATDPEGNYLEIRLTATDSRGLSKTVTRRLEPKTVDVSFQTHPDGLQLNVNGETVLAPRTFLSWQGYKINVYAPSPQTLSGTAYAFASWSDGGAQSHDVISGSSPGAYTATYEPTGAAVGGLTGQYYDAKDFTVLKLTRVDPTVNFSWGSGSPDPSIAPDTFSVRWSGRVKADHSETYTFYATANDGVRVWVDGRQIINRWIDGAQTNSGSISLQAGWHDMTMEYYEGSKTASARLEYASASTARQIVPSDHLSPATGSDTSAPTVVGTVPADGETGVAVSTDVTASFSEEMDPSTVNGSTFALVEQGGSSGVAATVTYDSVARKAILKPGTTLKAGTTYTATVKGGAGGVKDVAGNPLGADKNWSFTTSTSTPTPSIYELKVSANANRSGASALASATVSGNIYVFTAPDTGVIKVSFFLDDPTMSSPPSRVETAAPFDFKGGTVSAANAFDTKTVSEGQHVISAKLFFSDGTVKVVSAAFTVDNVP